MHRYLGILSSDTVNRDGYLIAFEALEDSIAKNAIEGLPSLIEHDIHRPLGWIFPFGVLIEPKISKTIGNFFICDNEEDSKLIYPKIQDFWNRKHYEGIKDYKAKFIELLNENYNEEGQFIEKGCVAYLLPNIAEKVFPSLFVNTDKDGLIYLKDILDSFTYEGSGIFKSKNGDLCIFCHQYFNRNLSLLNNYNTYFIDEFVRLHSNNEITLRIAIDKNLIGLSKTYKGVLEFDYWWGPKFNNDISSIPNEVTRYESNEEQKFFSSVLGTEFWWKTDENEKTLEIEEIREQPSLGIDNDSYGCRYIHSIYDNNKAEFIHFDGAIRLYSDEEILKRWEVNINKAGKNTTYTKLFRIDGKLELSDWKKLCILYYKGNPLLFEYFGVQEEYENLRNETKSIYSKTDYTPYKISSDDGIRLFVSYHKKSQTYGQFERKIINPDIIKFQNGNAINVIEYDIIEIEKYLKRNDGRLEYPNEISFVKPFDFSTNYPIIIHGSDKTDELIENTLTAFKTIFHIQNEKLNKTIAFTIGWEMKDFEVRLSVFGKSSEIVKWLTTKERIPIDYENFKDWLSAQRKWIYDNYKYSERDFSHLLKDDGIFYIKRKAINNENISFPKDEDEFYYEINTNGDKELNKLLEEKVIFPSHLGLLKKISCTKTGENYLTSNTSKYLDSDVKMAIEKIELLGFFWTDEEYK
jgi:hypothetical protein